MSSLWALIRKRGEIGYDPNKFSADEVDKIFKKVMAAHPVLINISDQAEGWYGEPRDLDFASLDATPCFPCLWMEWTPRANRTALFIERFTVTTQTTAWILSKGKKMALPKEGSKYLIQMLAFSEHAEGEYRVGFHGVIEFYVDALGHPQEALEIAAHEHDVGILTTQSLLAADVLTTMNTCGTRIEPPVHQPAQIVKPDRAPCSVWHTIHIPKFRNPPLAGTVVTPEVLECREHWVRGHRRDYRNGNGMFGRIKALVWVPEYQRGNSELGTVHKTYEVRKSE